MWVRRTLCLMTVAALGQGVVGSPPVAAQGPSPAPAQVRSSLLADTWGPVQRFERNPWGESMTVDARGVTWVAWASTKSWPHRIKVAKRTAAGTWKDKVTIGRGDHPVVAADAKGTVTVAWERERNGLTTGVWAARKVVRKAWSKPVHLSVDKPAPGYPDGGDVRGVSDLALAVHPKGQTLVAWQWTNRTPSKIQTAFRTVRGPWRGVVDLTPAANATNPLVSFGPTGRAWVAFSRTPVGGTAAVKVRDRLPNGTWFAPARVGRGRLGGLGVDRYSQVTVAFRKAGAVRTALWSPVAGWQEPTLATPADASVQEWSFAYNRRGAAVVVYTRPDGRVDAARRTNRAVWGAPVTLADPGQHLFLTAAMNADGDMFAAWGSYGLWAAYRPSGGDWHATTTVQPDSGVDVLETTTSQVAPHGDAVLLWDQEERPLRARVLSVS